MTRTKANASNAFIHFLGSLNTPIVLKIAIRIMNIIVAKYGVKLFGTELPPPSLSTFSEDVSLTICDKIFDILTSE